MIYAIVLCFGATFSITLFIDSFFGVSNICSDSFKTSSVWNGKKVFFRRFYSWLSFCLQRNSSSFLLYVFPSYDALDLKHHSALQLELLLNVCSIGTLLDSLNSSIVFSLLFFIMYPKYFLSWRASDLLHLHHWALLLWKMENMCLATTFTLWEVSEGKYGSGVSSSSFPLDELRTWPRAPLDGFLSTAHIVLL